MSSKRKCDSGSGTLLTYFKKKNKITETSESGTNRKEETNQTNETIHTKAPKQNDIGLYTAAAGSIKLDTQKRLDLLRSVWTPESTYKFPVKGKRNLKFQYHWLQRWKWISYSENQEGVFCKYCVLFAPNGAGVGSQPLKKFVKHKFDNWKDAVEEFNKHEKTTYHNSSIISSENLLAVADKKQDSVELHLNVAKKKQIQENQQRIKPIIETVLFCGRQGLSLRGHRDSGVLNLEEEPEINDGNFRSLLRYRAKGGDQDLIHHFQSCGQNASYVSPQTQNEIIDASNQVILEKLIKRVNEAKGFSVLADETTDISGIEQVSLCVRYVDLQVGKIREDFLQFVPVTDVTGKGLATVILDSLHKFGVDVQYLRGQGYDGAASMSGCFNGVQAHTKEIHPLAMYVHCSSHCLNLAISSACMVGPVRNCMGTVGNVYVFFNTPKRQHTLTTSIDHIAPEASTHRLKKLCPTRWVERHDSIINFVELLDSVVDALEVICSWPDRDCAATANQLLCAIRQPSFLLSLHVVAKVFAISLPLSRFLQTENMDLTMAMGLAANVEDTIKCLRTNVNDEFSVLYAKVQNKCENYGISLVIPRVTKRQTQRCNIVAETPEEYFRAAIFVPFLDSFLMQLHERLLVHKTILSNFKCLLPDGSVKEISDVCEMQVKELARTYERDINCSEEIVIAELRLWYQRIAEMESIPANAIDAFHVCNENIYPSVKKLLQILATIPVTTSSSERSFSTLRRLKTYLRNSTGEGRLNGLALMNIHRDISVSVSEVLVQLSKKPRRLNFRLE